MRAVNLSNLNCPAQIPFKVHSMKPNKSYLNGILFCYSIGHNLFSNNVYSSNILFIITILITTIFREVRVLPFAGLIVPCIQYLGTQMHS